MYRRGGGKKEQGRPAQEEDGAGGRYAELLVFGYASKLFRDDERAIYHEQGKHLIPWMGDKNIMIDRYDGRGHLHDLSEYDAGSWNHAYRLSEEEARIEALCDEERYLALHTDLLEEEARQEEEYKRLSEALADEGSYNAVSFCYSADYYDPSQPTEEEEAAKEPVEPEPQDSEEPFVAPPGLVIPPDVELPATTKMHAIIERTASFVCKQGAQFEIMLKAKQSLNSQFDFLRFDHYLNPYYRHILRSMKEGSYVVSAGTQPNQANDAKSDASGSDDDEDGDGSYLHPSLFASKKSSRLEELMKPLQVMDPDHPLAALVRKAQQDQNGAGEGSRLGTERVEATAAPTEYTTDPNIPMYYGYCLLPDGSYCLAPPPPGIEATSYYSSPPAGRLPPVTSSSSTTTMPPPPGTTPPPTTDPVATPAPASRLTSLPAAVEAPAASTRAPAPVPAIIPPPPDVQPVIDKLAEYVARNGVKFEASVRAKNDPRFDFLQSWHQYNTYYEFKKHYYMQKEGVCLLEGSGGAPGSTGRVSTSDGLVPEEGASGSSKEGKLSKASFAPICFAIKAKENDLLPLEKNRVRLDDDSDEEQGREAAPEPLPVGGGGPSPLPREPPPAPSLEEKKPTLSLEELEAKQAKQKLEARLAAAAREKLAQASKESKEKQLQAERKRKAALFLQTLRAPQAADDPPAQPEPEVLSCLPPPSPPAMSRLLSYPVDPRPVETPSLPPPLPPYPSASPSPLSSSSSHRDHDRERRKKKHKRRSRSRSRSRSPPRAKNKHSLPSAYRSVRKSSRSRSRTPSRRDRRREEWEREKEPYVPSAYRHGNSAGVSKKHSRSRSPHEKRKRKSAKSHVKLRASSCSPASSPGRSRKRATARSSSPASVQGSPASSLQRGTSQDRQKQVASAIVSSVQTKITQDLMAKVRAMLASPKDMQTSTS
ncbi:splicing factor, suppressor of white-apricot homolog isoform X1 [Paramormyrops kingsleyae]|uniref:splicing factor, suppressor of white-apricot homolog isoform X1 n=1 Tax=Paramormyrops kingsleyae TaxID=1676925 RepID=UPI003B9778D2